MKKLTLFTISLLLLALISTPFAWGADHELVYDTTGVLSQAQVSHLSTWTREVSDTYKCDVIVYITDKVNGMDPEDVAWEFFDENLLGFGEDESAVMLMLATVDRKVAVVAQGYGNDAFTDYGKDIILDDFLVPLLRDNKWADAALMFVEKAEEFLKRARDGDPVDVIIYSSGQRVSNYYSDGQLHEEDNTATVLAVSGITSLVIAFLMCQIWASQMKTAQTQRAAAQYVTSDGLNLTEQEDRFLYRTQTRRTIQSSSSSSGSSSRGGTSTSSSGRSGSSRSF